MCVRLLSLLGDLDFFIGATDWDRTAAISLYCLLYVFLFIKPRSLIKLCSNNVGTKTGDVPTFHKLSLAFGISGWEPPSITSKRPMKTTKTLVFFGKVRSNMFQHNLVSSCPP